MRLNVAFHVDGIPKAQPRPRAFARTVCGVARARVFDSGTAEGWKALVAAASQPRRPQEPVEGPVEVVIEFYLPRPKRLCRKSDETGPLPCTSKPDCDNLAKAVLDCLTQQGWWLDDSQVFTLSVRKRWHAKGGRPGAFIQVWEPEPAAAAGASA